MQIDRYANFRGPAICVLKTGDDTHKLFAKGDVTIDFGIDTATQTSSIGDVETFRTGVNPTITLTPFNQTNYFDLFAALATMRFNDSMVGALKTPAGGGAKTMADNVLIVQPLNPNVQQYTFTGVGISATPGMTFSTTDDLFDGSLTFRAVGKNNVAPNAADRLFIREANAYDGIGYDASKNIRQAYQITHAQVNGGQAFGTVAGAKLALGLKVNELKADGFGVYDLSFGGLTPVVTLTPLGVSDADIAAALKLQGVGSEIGSKLSAVGGDLVLTGQGVYLKVPLAGVRKAGVVRGPSAELLSAFEFVGAVSIDGNGDVAPRFVLGEAAP